jgi:DNA polymerase-3 subunit epsilon
MNESAQWADLPIASVDVETTGLDPQTDRVIEIAIIHMRQGEVEERWSTLVNPGIDIPDEVTRITGIKTEDLAGAPVFETLLEEITTRLRDRVLVAYNLEFDRAFIKNELERAGSAWEELSYVDPLIFARELHRNQGSKRLGAVAERLGIEIGQAHRAADDAIAAGKVLYAFAGQLPTTLAELTVLQGQWATQQENERASWRSRRDGGPESVIGTQQTERGNSLGPAYIYGEETDPVRAMFLHLPDSGSKR